MLDRPPPADLAIDTSALMAVLLGDQTQPGVRAALRRTRGPIISAANVAELLMVAEGRNPDEGADDAEELLETIGPAIVPVDRQITELAHRAWRRFGKGNHPARLNYGDCFAYATARHWEVPLLCVGDDFAKTDLEVVALD